MRIFASILRLFSEQLPLGTDRTSNRTFESLESRSLLAADLSINSFSSDGVNLVVDFQIADQFVPEFNISIYRSYDGISLDQLLISQRIDGGPGIGSQQVSIPAAFSDLLADYQLVAVIDDGAEIQESNEWNNQATFVGGAFVDADWVLQVHGTENGDFVSIYQDSYLNLDLNGVAYSYLITEITGIAVRTHAADDWVLADYYLPQAVLAFGGADNDVLLGGAGNDHFYGGSGSDYLIGGDGNDSLFGEEGGDYLSGDDGNDLLDGGAGADTVLGGAGADTLGDSSSNSSYDGYGDTLDAGEGDDIIYGTNGDDIIYGGAGNDTIYGTGGNDQLFGDGGDDYLDGGDGHDYLYGGAGSDTLYGGAGYDSLFGDDGDDSLYGGSEDDYVIGGNGHDAYNAGGETGDIIGDRPSFANVTYRYNGLNKYIYLSGAIVDDGGFANLSVFYSGLAQGSMPLNETGSFEFYIGVSNLGNGWLFLDFTDSEGLEAPRFIMHLT